MGKGKKKNKNDLLALSSLGLIQEEPDGEEVETPALKETEGSPEVFFTPKKSKLLIYDEDFERRYRERKIPLLDSGIRESEIRKPSQESLDAWYASNHIGKYVHMEVVNKDGYVFRTKRVQFEFSRMLAGYQDNLDYRGVNPAIERFSFADISKASFLNNIDNPLRYINGFIQDYDPDDELMMAYFLMMYNIMHKDIDLDPASFIETIYAAFTTETMIEKVYRMVEYNVDENLVKESDRAYDESIQLTVDHLKAIMGVSCLHKFAIPIVSHYFKTRSNLLEREGITDKELYYYVFDSFVPAFDEIYGIDLGNKLYHTSTSRITKTTNSESVMWQRRERLGVTPVSFANTLIREFVVDISQKALFSQSAIIFLHVCMDGGIKDNLNTKDKYDFTEMPMISSDAVNETISRWDRYQTDKSFHSQRDRIRSCVSIKDMLYRMGLSVGLDFKKMKSKKPKDVKATAESRDEFAYYRDNIAQPFNPTQIYLIQLFYSKMAENGEDANNLEPADIIKTIMIMKRDLKMRNYNYLPFFISGEVDVTAAKSYNKRKIQSLIEMHPLYPDLKKQYRYAEGALNWNQLINKVRTFVACPIKVVDYEYSDLRGQIMRYDERCAVDEIMRFYHSL